MADFREHPGQEFLTAETRADRHDENDVTEVKDEFDQLYRACRVERDAGLLAEGADLREGRVEVGRRRRLRVDEEMIGAGLGEGREIALGLGTLSGFRVERRTASTITGPRVIFGTKRPSMTSR